MDTIKYLKSLSMEFDAVENRVRNFIDTRHWLTDGEWKESVLRTILRRHLPADIGIGRGFVISSDHTSHQIDVLLYNKNIPLLFQDGELVFVTPDAVRGIIEVKSNSTIDKFTKSVKKLSGSICQFSKKYSRNYFLGYFSYNKDHSDILNYLAGLQESTEGSAKKIFNFITLDRSIFIRYWEEEPPRMNRTYRKWHAYELADLSRGYFINNILGFLSPHSVYQNHHLWFPDEGKEHGKVAEISLVLEAR
jgi:hypothetical protein